MGGPPPKKRAAQNREAQRAFRLRKALYIQDLEAKAQRLSALEQEVEALSRENKKLQKGFEIMKLQVQHYKGQMGTLEETSPTSKKRKTKGASGDFLSNIETLSDVSSDEEDVLYDQGDA